MPDLIHCFNRFVYFSVLNLIFFKNELKLQAVEKFKIVWNSPLENSPLAVLVNSLVAWTEMHFKERVHMIVDSFQIGKLISFLYIISQMTNS